MLKKLGIKEWTEASYQTNTVRVDEAIDAIKKANPDVIGLFSVATATIELIKRLGVEFLPAKEKAFPDCDLLLPAQDDAYVVFVKAKDDPSIVDLGFELPPGKRYAVASSIAALVHASHIQWVIDLDKVFYDHNREVCWMQI